MVKVPAIWASAFLALCFLMWWTHLAEANLEFPSLVTGWFLFAVLIALALFNIRKKLSLLPLADSSTWLNLHLPAGFLAAGIFWLHVGSHWPSGFYEKFLALLFYLTVLTGILGLAIQRLFPRRLTQSGAEYIFERIPLEIIAIQEQAKDLLLTCARQTRQDTLAVQYLEHLDWYFQRPRFFLNHLLGSKKGETWIRQQCLNIELVLNPQEKTYLQKLSALANAKRSVDFHFALQTVLKYWLMFHLPLAAALMTAAVWHLLVIYVYFQ